MSSSTSRCVQISTPAKLNVFLELLDRRSDGFHELETIMLPINRYDTLGLYPLSEPRVETHCYWLPDETIARRRASAPASMMTLPRSEENLVTKALQAFRSAFGVEQGFRALIAKSIPSGAGMGGASSDAAAALMAAARMYAVDLQNPQLLDIAAGLGSDVPMFLSPAGGLVGPTRATGRGEQVERIACGGRLHFVVVQPPVSLSTAEVYQGCRIAPQQVSGTAMVQAIASGSAAQVASCLLNRLMAPAREISDQIDRALSHLGRLPVWGYQMTGSGSACFGICPNARTAGQLARRLMSTGIGLAFSAHTICLPTPTIQVH